MNYLLNLISQDWRNKMFCPECDSVLVPNKEKVLMCKDCGYQSEDDKINEKYIIKDEISEEQRTKIEVIDEDLNSGGVPEEMIEELREQYREALENFEL